MDEDANKPADQRAGGDRRRETNPDYGGPERRIKDRRADKPKPK